MYGYRLRLPMTRMTRLYAGGKKTNTFFKKTRYNETVIIAARKNASEDPSHLRIYYTQIVRTIRSPRYDRVRVTEMRINCLYIYIDLQ